MNGANTLMTYASRSLRRAVSPPIKARFFGLILAAFTLGTPAAQAQEMGLDHQAIVKQLVERHAERPAGIGLADNGGVIELYATEDGATWTLMLTLPDGRTLVVATGRDWSGIPTLVKGQPI